MPTVEENLNYLDFYAQYLGDELGHSGMSDDGAYYMIRCPFHDDRSPSCGININTGWLHCFTEDKWWAPTDYLVEKIGIEQKDADHLVDLFRVQHQLTKKDESYLTRHLPGFNAKFQAMYEKSQDMMSPDHRVVKEYMRSRSINYDQLVAMKVGYLPAMFTDWKRDSLVFPYFHSGKIVGMHYRDEGGNKSGAKGSYMTLWGIDRITDESSIIVVVEGESDCIKSSQALGDGFTVVACPTAAFRREWAREFQDAAQVILIPQDDDPSAKMALQAAGFVANLTVLELPWGRMQLGKDIADWLKYHEELEFQNLVRSTISSRIQRVMTFNEFLQESQKPREWMITNLLSRGQICMLAGLPKTKKTFYAFNIIRSLLTNEPLHGLEQFSPALETKPNILLWEEEGPIEELRERFDLICGDVDCTNNVFVAHQLGLKLNDDNWIGKLIKEVDRHKIDLLFIDPFARAYSVEDENSASDMLKVWNGVARVMNRFPKLSIIILHHMNKSSDIENGGVGMRGSVANWGNCDLGIFLARGEDSDITRMAIDGRSVKAPIAPDGNKVFELRWNEGILKWDGKSSATSKAKPKDAITGKTIEGMDKEKLLEFMTTSSGIEFSKVLEMCDIAAATLYRWMKEIKEADSDKRELLITIKDRETGKKMLVYNDPLDF